MKIKHNIIILLFIATACCSTQKNLSLNNIVEEPFLTSDSVYSVAPSLSIIDNRFHADLKLTKLKVSDEYYFPSSERLRVVIKDNAGKTILNTKVSKDFFTAISPLEPKEIGETMTYGYDLDGVNIFENSNQITIILILPVKPNEIYFEKTINLKDNDK